MRPPRGDLFTDDRSVSTRYPPDMHALFLFLAASGAGRSTELGKIDFPVTASGAARQHFQRGVLALHSFFYDEAENEFREATKAQIPNQVAWLSSLPTAEPIQACCR